ncbi:glycoside hydrolase family 3 protein [Exilibacterium tricleocarpae]|uniref:Glycoside hydrolase family 3 protein n=1 Tax=Exilibacterium tricleocarpae TaxID=2591008 RepID=A0A545SLY5_9GAMM|nr:glycoside hydrolase family 3 N-terminal domain-containing protein [Exilibacterium tricleocarpae]TQV65971.1 glycoside hydrolase family 3 protein [Exilibacterium tricleocarpae]
MTHLRTALFLGLLLTILHGCSAPPPSGIDQPAAVAGNLERWPQLAARPADPAIERRIQALLAGMTLEQKVGQLMQPEIRHVSNDDVRRYYLGSVLNGGGSFPQRNKHASLDDWLSLADGFYHASMSVDADVKIPIVWGTDAVHGHNNVIGATLFPHNIALGAIDNPALIEAIGAATAREMAATGISWSFAPTVAVARDDRWGRTYESYSEAPALVGRYARAQVLGLQGRRDNGTFMGEGRVIATAKHFIGDGGTAGGEDRGDTRLTEEELIRIHAQGYFRAIEAGVQVVMASFTSWNGDKLHGHRYLLTDVLKNRLGFDGFVVGDWAGHQFVPGCTVTRCPAAINAGLDMFMAPDDNWRELYTNTLADVKAGRISMARLDDANARILRVKLRAGLFEKGAPSSYPLAARQDIVGHPEHRELARQAVRESLVLLKNRGQLLPLSPKAHVLVAGNGAHNIGKQSGGWSITWQGTGNTNADFPGATSVYDGIKAQVEAAGGRVSLSENGDYSEKPDLAIVVYGEDPYAEMQGDTSHLGYHNADDLALLRKLRDAGIKVVSLFVTGRPLAINPYLNASDAFVVIWLPGTEGKAVAEPLFTKPNGDVQAAFTGRLSFSWPQFADQAPLNLDDPLAQPLFAYGYGLANGDTDTLPAALPEPTAGTLAATPGPLTIFHRRTLSPWRLDLAAKGEQPGTMSTNSLTVGAINAQTRDRFMQEDTLEITWTGPAQAGFYHPSQINLSDFAGGSLVFEARLKNAADIQVGLSCQNTCRSTHLSEFVNPGVETWQSVRIPLACLSDDLQAVASPMQLSGRQGAEIALYNLRIERGNQTCPNPSDTPLSNDVLINRSAPYNLNNGAGKPALR